MNTHTQPKRRTIAVTIQTAGGHQRTVSTGTKDPSLARAIIKKSNIRAIEIAAKANALSHDLIQKLVVGKNITVGQAIDEWAEWHKDVVQADRTAHFQIARVRMWAREARVLGLNPSELTEHHISKWLNKPDGRKLSTKQAALAAIRSLTNYLSIQRYCFGNPGLKAGIKMNLLSHDQKEPKQKTVFTEKEFQSLIDHLEDRIKNLIASPKTDANIEKLETARFWYAALLIGRYSGLRIGDICTLEWKCLSTVPGKLVVWTDKQNTRVEIPIDDRLQQGISSIPVNNKAHCFPEQNALMKGPQSKQSKISVQFLRLLEAAGIKGHSFHDLRKTLAVELNIGGSTLEEIAKALGHRSKESTKGYIKP